MATFATQSNRSGSAVLDGAPPSPPDKIYPKKSAPGEDTKSLLGFDPQEEGEGDGSDALSQPGNRLLLSVAMFMQATNIAESSMPGFVPEPVKQWVAQAMQQAPQIAQQMSQMGNPAAMLSAVGQSGAASQNPPMGLPAMSPMGAGGGMAGGGMMGGGGGGMGGGRPM
jgi:hypothetical protein